MASAWANEAPELPKGSFQHLLATKTQSPALEVSPAPKLRHIWLLVVHAFFYGALPRLLSVFMVFDGRAVRVCL